MKVESKVVKLKSPEEIRSLGYLVEEIKDKESGRSFLGIKKKDDENSRAIIEQKPNGHILIEEGYAFFPCNPYYEKMKELFNE